MPNKIYDKMANTLRFLSADIVQKANSGHPGSPMGLSEIMVCLNDHLKHNPKNPKWLNRDRVVFSGGHNSALIYSLLYLWGYDLSLEDLKNFRQLNSKTPGHLENLHTDGVEITTGPLGQGIANAVGFAMASKWTGYRVNSETCSLIDHKVWCFCGDGDLEEGISYEACSLAGHLNLKNLILVYDKNSITIDGNINIAWSENIEQRFKAQNWNVLEIDGHSFEEIDSSFTKAKKSNKPTIIIAKTVIGKGVKEVEGTPKAHGSPIGENLIQKAKKRVDFPENKTFYIPEDVLIRFRASIDIGEILEKEWIHRKKETPLIEQNYILERLLNRDFSSISFPNFEHNKEIATRDSNHQILNAISKAIPSFIGGSADLSASNKTKLENMGTFPKGKNINFGIREHSMAGITNAMALYGTIIPFNSTFFVFSDYLKPSVRVAALSKIQNFFIWTHDSIGVGEDGATHQPIEHISQFRALPNFYLWRPADGNENVESWKKALRIQAPQGFVLSRQKLQSLDENRNNIVGDVSKGAYLLRDNKNAQVIIMASGSEVSLVLKAANYLKNKENIDVNIVSVPCLDLFNQQSIEYKEKIINPNLKVLAVEAGVGVEYYRYANEVLGMESFGASAPAKLLFNKFGFNIENIISKITKLSNQN